VPTNRNEGEPSSFRSGLGVAQIKRIFEAWNPDEIMQAAHITIGRYAIENTPLSPGFRNENPVSPRPFCDAKISCEYHGRGKVQEAWAPTPRNPSGPQKYAVDVKRVGEVPSVRMFSCLCANNSLTGVRLECSRLRTVLARTRADNPDKFNERT
jgi:hypothetical protein